MQSPLLTSLNSEGYVLIPSLLVHSEITTLRTACQDLRLLAEAGKWPYLRTLPKQFPPWSSDPSNGIWGIQHLLHPDNPYSTLFASTYFSDSIINTVTELLNCSESDLVMELYNLLLTPTRDFALRWHRDDIPPDASPEEEVEKLSRASWHAQWNLALFDDESLIVVSGSHARARNVLQHGVGEWVRRCDFSGLQIEKVRGRAEGMRKRLLEMGDVYVGYSQDD